jgi:hypothetical protein
MSFDRPDDPRSRDTALARLVAEALKSQSKRAGDSESSSCPEAEVLAAYADHGLAEEETARWESHFADCNRCQKIIAVLAATGEEFTAAEVERLGNLAAASSVASESVVRNTTAPWIAIWRQPALWRWLVPAVGLASAALWFALWQAPPRGALRSQEVATTTGAPQSETVQRATAASPANSGETQMAQANLPAPPAEPPSAAPLGDRETAQANSSAAARQEPLRKQEASRSAAQMPPVSELDTLGTREESAKDNRVLSAQAAEQQAQVNNALTAAAPTAPAAAPSAPQPARDGERAVPQGFDSASGAPVPAQLKALAQTVTPAIVVASPNRRALWRLGSGGRIQHSTDQGQTWQPQTSGVTADLLGGDAPSEKIAWVVGRAGTIVRTEDGQHWQRVAPPSVTQAAAPSVPAPDWISVEVRDALHATITSRDGRRFVTEDGGRTWAPLQ